MRNDNIRIGMLDAYKVAPGKGSDFPMLDRYRRIQDRFSKVSILTHGDSNWKEYPHFNYDGFDFYLMPNSDGPSDIFKYVFGAFKTLQAIDAFVDNVDVVLLRVPHVIAPLVEFRARRAGKRVIPFFKGSWGGGIFDLPWQRKWIFKILNAPWELYHRSLISRYNCYSTGPFLECSEATLAMFFESAKQSVGIKDVALEGVPIRRILCIGRLTRAKGGDLFIEALAKLNMELPIYIVGDGPLWHAMEVRAAELGLANLNFLGLLTPDEVTDLYGPESMVVIPSRTEGIPKVFLEAIERGSPVVAPRVGGIPHLGGVEKVATLFEPGDIDSLSRAMADQLRAGPPSGGASFVLNWSSGADIGILLGAEFAGESAI